MSSWNSDSWRSLPIRQQPSYTAEQAPRVSQVEAELKSYPPIVDFSEIDELRKQLTEVEIGEAFVLQGGDCAEAFSSFAEQSLKNYFRLFLQMNAALVYNLRKPVVKIGRIAGQYAKPRSSDTEMVNGKEYPSYRGDIINSIDLSDREPNPERIKKAYFYSVATRNYLNLLASCGYGSLKNISKWNEEFLSISKTHNKRFEDCVKGIASCFDFIGSCRLAEHDLLDKASFFTSHESLLLSYDSSLVRQNPKNGKWYCLSSHQLWIGDRTRILGEAHVEFCRGIENPIGVKVGPTTDINDLLKIIDLLNPQNIPGKIILTIRAGVSKFDSFAPKVIEQVKRAGKRVILQSDPMHGNVIKANNGYKTRKFDDITAELTQFFTACKKHGVHPGGIHVEITGNNVTECLGGGQGIEEENLAERYHTHCDPRLNSIQALELAFVVSDLLFKG